jgi:hypothetical protein
VQAFDIPICLYCIRYRARSRRKPFDIGDQKRQIGASSEYRTRYRIVLLDIEFSPSMYRDSKGCRIGASSEHRTMYRRFLIRYRSYDFDIEVMTSI